MANSRQAQQNEGQIKQEEKKLQEIEERIDAYSAKAREFRSLRRNAPNDYAHIPFAFLDYQDVAAIFSNNHDYIFYPSRFNSL